MYDFTSEKAIAIAAEQALAFERHVSRVDTIFETEMTRRGTRGAAPDRAAGPVRGGRGHARRPRWRRLVGGPGRIRQRPRCGAAHGTPRHRGRRHEDAPDQPHGRRARRLGALARRGTHPRPRRPNSSFSEELTDQEQDRVEAAVEPIVVKIARNEVVVRNGTLLTAADIEKIDALGLGTTGSNGTAFVGWFALSVLLVGMLLAWIWRFRPALWHRDNVLFLIGMLVAGATLALKITAGRSILQFFLPTAAIGMLLAILLDASLATIVIAIIAVIGGMVNGSSLEFTTYTFLGGVAGIIAVRKGDRLQVFVQAAFAIFIVQAAVVTVFSLLGERDVRGLLELWFASAASAAGSGVAAVGLFAVLGSVFGILTVFQLLELANPSQPLLRRLLVETPGTYHHSLMVGNLAERAAEAIGGDPLVTRVAAYYHDIGKLANPLGFIENQAGGENIHDELDPEVSAQIVKQHVADGIDLAYKAKLPKALIAYIPQHHGTAIMSYFYARAQGARGRRRTAASATVEGAKAAAAVDERKFRHAGPEAPDPRSGADHAGRRRRGVRALAVRPRRAGHPGDGHADHGGARQRRPVRRMRPDPARPRADPRGLRPAAPGHVPLAHRLSAERGRGPGVASGGGRRRRRGLVTRAPLPRRRGGWTSRSAMASARPSARRRSFGRSPPPWMPPARHRRPRSG